MIQTGTKQDTDRCQTRAQLWRGGVGIRSEALSEAPSEAPPFFSGALPGGMFFVWVFTARASEALATNKVTPFIILKGEMRFAGRRLWTRGLVSRILQGRGPLEFYEALVFKLDP